MPKYWLISDRNGGGTGIGINPSGVTYWISDAGPLNDIDNWKKVGQQSFQKLLKDAADQFPDLSPARNEEQKHVCLLIHGFNASFASATTFYENLCTRIFDGDDGLGICVLYDWPSLGNVLRTLRTEDVAHDGSFGGTR